MLSKDIADFLAQELPNTSQSKGDNPEWLIRIADFDGWNKGELVVFDLPSTAPRITLDKTVGYNLAFQVRIRGRSRQYEEAYGMARSIIELFVGVQTIEVNGRKYSQIIPQNSSPIWLGYTEENQKPDMTTNFNLIPVW